MIYRKLMLLAVTILGLSRLATESAEHLPCERDRYLLIEHSSASVDDASPLGSLALKEAPINPNSELGRFLQASKIEKWKVFEDEHVKFEYPDFPGIEVSATEKRLAPGSKIYGEPVSTVNRRSSRFYSIKSDEVTWAVLMLQDGSWFDEGICLCGAVAIRVYVPDVGHLRAYDLLEDGRLKKMQVLGNGKRLQVFEWTHLPMTQGNYLRFTETISLKYPSTNSEMDWMDEFRKSSRLTDIYGWLRPGMKAADVVSLLGEPDTRDGLTLVYKKTDEDKEWLTTTRIPLPDGAFAGLPAGWRTTVEIPPTRGTLRWALKLTDDGNPKLRAADSALLRKSCMENLSKCAADDWDKWVGVAGKLHENGWKESRLGSLVAARFLDKDVRVNEASILIGELNPPGTQSLVRKRLRFVLDESGTEEVLKNKYLPESLDEFHNLLCQINDKNQRLLFLREGIAHPHRGIRFDAYSWLDRLPPSEAIAASLKGLDDSDEYVRRDSAKAFAGKVGTKENLQTLRDHAQTEKDGSVKKDLVKAISRLEVAR